MTKSVNSVFENGIESAVSISPTAASFDVERNDSKKAVASYISCKNGIKIERSIYKAIHRGILALLKSQAEVSPDLFFAALHEQFSGMVGKNVGWYVFQVKLEMEARGLLKTRRSSRNRSTVIAIIPSRRNRLQNRSHDAASIFSIGQAKKLYELESSSQPVNVNDAHASTSSKAEFVVTRKSSRCEGITMPAELYDSMKREMFLILENKEEGILLASFYELLCVHFAERLRQDTGWYLYHVKLDLETRGLIKVEHCKRNDYCQPVVKLSRNESYKKTLL